MKVFLSSLENSAAPVGMFPVPNLSSYIISKGVKMKWNLISYYYVRGKTSIAEQIRDYSELVVVDSGAHSFQFGKKVDFEEYTKGYAEWIKKFDRPNVLGYFEMDVDNVLGYEKVLELREVLEAVSDKIIPVWHKERGIEDFYEMCEKYAGKVISITGFSNADIRDDQYLAFVKYAKKHECKVFCLGMTRKKVLDKVPFDFVDSSSWHQSSIYGRPLKPPPGKKFAKPKDFIERMNQEFYSYRQGMALQEHYYKKWRKACQQEW